MVQYRSKDFNNYLKPKMKKQLTRLAAAVLTMLVWSCNQSDPDPQGDYIRGVFVINEGNFFQNNGALSFITREQSTAEVDVFAKVNNTPLKGGVQGYAYSGDQGLILVDNSSAGLDKVEFVDANTLASQTSIGAPDIENPREVVFAGSGKAYVSCWGANSNYDYKTGYVAVIDLATKKVTKKINIASGPENLVYNNGKLYVGTVSYGGGKSLTVINVPTDEIVKTVALDDAPTPIGFDANGKLWVGAGLKAVKINPDSYAIEASLPIGSNATKTAGNFALSADLKTIFFVLSYFDAKNVSQGEIYKFNITDAQINVTTPVVKRYFSGLSVDPSQGLLYTGVSPSFAQAGYAIRYRADGTLVDSIKVGVAPTGFVFR
jgi:YVTN family beta-propeller protein